MWGAARLAHAVTHRGRFALVGLTVLVTLAVAFDQPPQIRGPAPYPPEWQWPLREGSTSGRFGWPLLAAAALLGLLVASASGWARARPRRAARVILAAATLAGFAFSLGLLALEPAGATATLAARAMSTSWSSYYTVAVSPEAADPLLFLDRHAEILPRLPKHAATHPPGPVLYYRALIAFTESRPLLARALLALQGHDESRPPRPPNTPASKAAALLGALLLTLLGAAAAWPVAAIAERMSGDSLSGARAGVLWTLLPGPALFVPQFDHALAFPVAGTAALLLSAVGEARAPSRHAKAVLAGLFAGVALLVSYGSVVFLGFAALAVLAVAGSSRKVVGLVVVAALAVAGVIGVTSLLGHEPIAAARTAIAIHRETYTRPRSYALWLPSISSTSSSSSARPWPRCFAFRVARSRLARAVAAGLAVLVLSGATRGEVGRIWIPLMPFVLVGALAEKGSPSLRDAVLIGALLVAIDLALRIHWNI